jgi:hypothetical protein
MDYINSYSKYWKSKGLKPSKQVRADFRKQKEEGKAKAVAQKTPEQIAQEFRGNALNLRQNPEWMKYSQDQREKAFALMTAGNTPAPTPTPMKPATSVTQAVQQALPAQKAPELTLEDIIDKETMSIEEERKKEREILEKELGIVKKKREDQLATYEENLDVRKEGAKQSAINRYFGGLEGARTATGALLPEAVVTEIDRVGQQQIMQLKNDILAGDVEALALMQDFDSATRQKITDTIDKRTAEYEAKQDKAIEQARQERKDYMDEVNFRIGLEKDQMQMESMKVAEQRAKEEYLEDVAFDLYDRFGGNVAGGALVEYFNEIGLEYDPKELLGAVTKDDIMNTINQNSEMMKIMADLEPAEREYLLETLPESQEKIQLSLMNEAISQKHANNVASVSKGGSTSDELEINVEGVSNLFKASLEGGLNPNEFRTQVASAISTTDDKRLKLMEEYTKMWLEYPDIIKNGSPTAPYTTAQQEALDMYNASLRRWRKEVEEQKNEQIQYEDNEEAKEDTMEEEDMGKDDLINFLLDE